MESTKVSFEEFKKKKKKIYTSYRSLAEQHFKLINFLCFICYDYSTYYCFCEKCYGPELRKAMLRVTSHIQ